MPLRTPNDSIDATGILNAVAACIVPNTLFAQNNGTVFINNWDTLNGMNATYPGLVLESGDQIARRLAWRTWQASLMVHVQYADRWDTQVNTIDEIWANIDLDLHRMKANLEDNSTLTTGGVAHAINISDFKLTPYIGQRDERTGFTVVKRSMVFTAHMPLYTSTL